MIDKYTDNNKIVEFELCTFNEDVYVEVCSGITTVPCCCCVACNLFADVVNMNC